VNHESLNSLIEQIREVNAELGERAAQELLKEVRVAPTLVKYADPRPYEIETRRALRRAAAELMKNVDIAPAELVDLIEDHPLELELATTLLYEHSPYPYRQIRDVLDDLGEKMQREIIDLGMRHRGPHDELLRAFSSGQQFRFDILMDIGGFRDMHRHRRCIQIGQGFTTAHGYDMPQEYDAAGIRPRYEQIMSRAAQTASSLMVSSAPEGVQNSQYAIPLAYRKRTLFKMDFAEVVYIAELRTKVPGHRSYRRVAYAMFEAVAKHYPELSRHIRVTDIHEPVNLLER
jgi:thymidylate synthase ThyX